MDYKEFLLYSAHPENTDIACTTHKKDAKSLEAIINIEANSISAIKYNNKSIVALVEKNNLDSIYFYSSYDNNKWVKDTKYFKEINSREITTIHLFLYNNEIHLVYCTIDKECIIINIQNDARFVSNLGENIEEASIYIEDSCAWLFYGKCLVQKLKDDLSEVYGAPIKLKFDLNLRYHRQKRLLNYDGNQSPVVKKINGLYHMFLTDTTNRCYRESKDSYVAVSENIIGPYSRRYLLMPNGGRVSPFGDEDVCIAFIGTNEYSTVYNKPAAVELEKTDIGYLKPDSKYIYENTTIDKLLPVVDDIEIRDTFIFLAPDGKYYLTGTTRRQGGTFWNDTNGIQIWKSDDLEKFEFIGKVYDYHEYKDSWQKNISSGANTWAPEIAYFNDTFWITYSPSPSCGVLKSLSGKIEGPYLDMGRYVTNGIDSGFFIDDDGSVYFIYQNGKIAPLKKDGTGFEKDPVLLLPADGQQVGYEGAGIIKVMGKYVLFAAEWNGDGRVDGTYDMMYSVSDNIYGPYSPRRLLVPHGGHGCLFKDKKDNIRFTMFGNDRTAPFRRSVGIGYVNVKLENNELILWV